MINNKKFKLDKNLTNGLTVIHEDTMEGRSMQPTPERSVEGEEKVPNFVEFLQGNYQDQIEESHPALQLANHNDFDIENQDTSKAADKTKIDIPTPLIGYYGDQFKLSAMEMKKLSDPPKKDSIPNNSNGFSDKQPQNQKTLNFGEFLESIDKNDN